MDHAAPTPVDATDKLRAAREYHRAIRMYNWGLPDETTLPPYSEYLWDAIGWASK